MKFQLLEKVHISRASQNTAIFAPAVFFLMLAMAVVFAPGLVLALIASFFIFLAVVFSYLGYKLVQFKRTINKTLNEMKGHIAVQAFHVVDPQTTVEREVDYKKITWH